ncbi:MAG TPA: WS/DGAT domain-containing protein, partial [Planctomycetota bacterium]|nr:WS/DGAT domain-containing protein [Planctomycetota bacterium]
HRILQAVGALPARVEDRVVDLFASKASLVLTNVPGPRAPISIAGRPVRSLMFWVPQGGAIGVGVSLVTYAGEARIGVATDAAVIARPEAVVRAFEDEVDALAGSAGLAVAPGLRAAP